jgi:hypothetical protein
VLSPTRARLHRPWHAADEGDGLEGTSYWGMSSNGYFDMASRNGPRCNELTTRKAQSRC